MNTSNVPTQRIGDANVFQASSLANLNELPTNGNLNIKTNIDDLHLYDNSVLENSVLYSTLESNNPTQGTNPNATSESGQYVFQFSTPNWSNNREYYLELPVTLEVALPATQYYQHDPAYINNMRAGTFYNNWTIAGFYNVDPETGDPYNKWKYDTSVIESFSAGFFPNEAVIQLFKSFQVYGGTNNQPLGRTSMFQQPNLTNINYGKTSDEEASINGYSGVPLSNTAKRGIVKWTSTGGYKKLKNNGLDYDTEGLLARQINIKAMSSFEATVRMCSSGCGGVIVGPEPTTATGDNPVTRTYKNSFIISIPLYKLSEFFRLNIYTPPAMVYKITMDYYTKAIDIYQGSMLRNDGSQGKVNPATFKLNVNYLGGSPQIKYRSMVLTPALQDQLNQRWARNVITYNMETAENVTISGRQWPYSSVISTSSQRPLNLRICVVATNDSLPNEDGTAPTVKYINNQLVPWLDNDYQLINIQEISVSISGKNVLRYENLSVNQQGIIPTGYENINTVMTRKSGKGYSSFVGDDQSVRYGTFSGGAAGVPIDLSITPNMIWGNGYYATDQGAVQIKLDIKTDKPLHPDFNISVYKLYTTQLSLDTNLKVTLTEWPSRVIQNQGISTLQQNTVIPGN